MKHIVKFIFGFTIFILASCNNDNDGEALTSNNIDLEQIEGVPTPVKQTKPIVDKKKEEVKKVQETAVATENEHTETTSKSKENEVKIEKNTETTETNSIKRDLPKDSKVQTTSGNPTTVIIHNNNNNSNINNIKNKHEEVNKSNNYDDGYYTRVGVDPVTAGAAAAGLGFITGTMAGGRRPIRGIGSYSCGRGPRFNGRCHNRFKKPPRFGGGIPNRPIARPPRPRW